MVETEWQIFQWGIKFDPDLFPFYNPWKQKTLGFQNRGQKRRALARNRLIKIDAIMDPFQPSVVFHIETSHLICNANQMTGFHMKCNTGLRWVNPENWCLNLSVSTDWKIS